MSQPPAAAGSTVIATTIDRATAIEMVSARSAKIWPSTSRRNSTGRKTAIVVTVEAIKAGTTSRVPVCAASTGVMPPSLSRMMLPETTIAPSTTMPTAKASPASEITLRVRPPRSSAPNVASRQTGIATAISKVARQSRMNHQTQIRASRAPMIRFSVSRLTARWMNSEES